VDVRQPDLQVVGFYLCLVDLLTQKAVIVSQAPLLMSQLSQDFLLQTAVLHDVGAIVLVLGDLFFEVRYLLILFKLKFSLGSFVLQVGKLLLNSDHVFSVCRQKVFFVLLQLHVHPIVKHHNFAVDAVNKS